MRLCPTCTGLFYDDVNKWKHVPRYWSFARGIHRSPVDSPHKDQWRGTVMFSLICAWINGLANNRDAGDLRRHRAHYDVNVIHFMFFIVGITLFSVAVDVILSRFVRWKEMIDTCSQQTPFIMIPPNANVSLFYHAIIACKTGNNLVMIYTMWHRNCKIKSVPLYRVDKRFIKLRESSGLGWVISFHGVQRDAIGLTQVPLHFWRSTTHMIEKPC